jgi:beta-glucanase (GH16 family)
MKWAERGNGEKTLFLGGLISGLVFILSPVIVRPADAAPPGFQLLWSDEFNQTDGTGPDAGKWVHALGDKGWGNKELENYTDRLPNASVVSDPLALDGKALQIKAIKEADGTYNSARLLTKGKFSFKYGWAEARLRLPYGQGIWPAFWMLGMESDYGGWPHCGEIDIMENIGKVADQPICHGTIHGPGYSGDRGLTSVYTLPNGEKFKEAYHLFAVEWTVNKIKFYVDGHLYKTRVPADLPTGTKWVFDHPFYLLLNLAVGGQWPGYPDSSTVFPQTLMVDYVRVYQKAPLPSKPETSKH